MTGVDARDARDGMAAKGLDTQGKAAEFELRHSRRPPSSILLKMKTSGIKAPTLMPMKPTPKMHKDGLTRRKGSKPQHAVSGTSLDTHGC